MAENYNKVLESLGIRFIRCNNISVSRSFCIEDFQESENVLLFLRKGDLTLGDITVPEGQAILVPDGRTARVCFGKDHDSNTSMTMEEFRFRRGEFFSENGDKQPGPCEITMLSFEARVFDTVSFFHTLEIPSFSLDHSAINNLIYEITREQNEENEGFQRVISLKTEQIVIEIVRYILDNSLFDEKMATNSTYFKDPRLIKLFKYIKENLNGELTNKKLAEIAGVSEDYVGQYFKALTGINPQDYIEYQRMEFAVDLLRTTKMSIRDVGKSCGYKDTAYFCRRFKMMYGIPAGKMRKRETLINVPS